MLPFFLRFLLSVGGQSACYRLKCVTFSRDSDLNRAPPLPMMHVAEVGASLSMPPPEDHLVARIAFEDAWMESNSALLEETLSTMVQMMAEARPTKLQAYMVECLTSIASGRSVAPPSEEAAITEEEWMFVHGLELEGIISDMLRAAAQARPIEPVTFLASAATP